MSDLEEKMEMEFTLNYGYDSVRKSIDMLTLDDIDLLIWNQNLQVKTIATPQLLRKFPVLKEYIKLQTAAEKYPITTSTTHSDTDSDRTTPFISPHDSADEGEFNRNNYIKTMDNNYINAGSKTEEESDLDCWINIHDSNASVLKQIARHGISTKKAVDGDTCVINLVGAHQNGKIVDMYLNRKICVGARDISEGVDIAVKTMNLDECARVRVKPDFLFDKFGLRYDNIEARSFFFYTIRLLSIERKAEKSAGGKNLPGAGEKTPEADNVSESGRSSSRSAKINQVSDCSVLQHYVVKTLMEDEIMKQSNLEIEETPWYKGLDLAAFEANPVDVYTRIAFAEIIHGNYCDALQTVDCILKLDPSNLTASYLKEIVTPIKDYKPGKDLEEFEYRSDYSSKDPKAFTKGDYRRMKLLKENILRKRVNETKYTLGNKIVWFLAVGMSAVTVGTAIKKFCW